MKTCIKCNQEYHSSEFYKNKDSRLNTCKYCCRDYNRKYKQKHKERLYKETQEWKSLHKEEIQAYMKQYRYDNKEHILEVQKAWKLIIENITEQLRMLVMLKEDLLKSVQQYLGLIIKRLKISIK